VTAGFAAATVNTWLDTLDSGHYAQLHTGDPGSAGTSSASAETTRKLWDFADAAAGSKSAQGTLPSWATWSAGSETISHVSVWSASSGGTFKYSYALTASKSVTNGDTLNLTSHSVSITPIAA
jgi:hypothetical protein